MTLKHDDRELMAQLFFEKAHKALRSAKNNVQDDPDNAINRAYYSMFYAAQGALVLKGVEDLKKHQGVINKFGEFFIRTGLVEAELGKNIRRIENLRYDADYDPHVIFSPEKAQEQVVRAEKFIVTVENVVGINQEQNTSNLINERNELPNMAEVQAAESKASLVHSLDKSADGMSAVEGKDIGYIEEGYMAAANEVKYEAQEARTVNIEAQALKVGQRVTFQAKDKGSSVKLTGIVEQVGTTSIMLRCGIMSIPVAKESGVFSLASSASKEHTQEFAKEHALQALGAGGKVLLARHKGTYSGKIIGKTSTFAIQKINDNTAVLHRLKDLESKEKDAQGLIKEGEELTIVREGTTVSLSRLEPGARDDEKVRTQQKTRGGLSR